MTNTSHSLSGNYFTGKLLISMPVMNDIRFNQTVIFVCGHDDLGAMGLIINKPLFSVSFKELLEQVDLEITSSVPHIPIFYGGSVDMGRGFVLHSVDYIHESSVVIPGGYALTATLDVLQAIMENKGPQKAFIALGYVGWGPGQLENEVLENNWLILPPDEKLVFDYDTTSKWRKSLGYIGVDPVTLSMVSGHA